MMVPVNKVRAEAQRDERDVASTEATRRAPVQARSKRRWEAILEISASLVDEFGPDEVTTTLIAERLGISVGSIYSYFSDRSAIFDAIVVRSIVAHYELSLATRANNSTAPVLSPASWIEGSFAVIDRLAEAYRTEPGFRRLWFSPYLSAEMLVSMQRTDEAQAQRLLWDLRAAGLELDCPSPLDTMRVYVGLIDKGLDLAFRHDPQGSARVIAETKQVVRAYIGSYLRSVGTTQGSR